ncbi:MAG: cyclase family protein [Alphaproteobacteria bacterium]
MKTKKLLRAATAAAALLGVAACADMQKAQDQAPSLLPSPMRYSMIADLTHPIPMFHALGKDVTKADTSKPFKDSRPVAGFGFQPTRIPKPDFKTKVGNFQWAWFYMDEHYGTHIDSTDHYQYLPGAKTDMKPDNRSMEQYGVKDITGPIVFIDISARVDAELAKNKGVPSPDAKITNFNDDGPATVTAADIEKVRGQIVDGAWIVVRTGWDKFFVGASKDPFAHPYINGFNFPGMNAASVAKLIEIETAKKVRINGIIMDQLSIDSGHSGRGPTNNPFGEGWAAHNKGLQRGWKFVENAANLGQLNNAQPGTCIVVIGALKLVSASGSPARVLAMCQAKTR